ncbi:MAG: SEC-C domain-containing protein [Candidatus Sulfotelmatobacter sp.]
MIPDRDPRQSEPTPAKRQTITRSEGATDAERYLKKLCDRSFLSLWSYPGVFRDQGRTAGKGDGKEVCDLLVVFDEHIIIFSDKDCRFEDTGDIDVDWGRWVKKAILKSAQQAWGAERWIRNFPKRLFLDKSCTAPFPLVLPEPAKAIFHRVVVAHDASRRCREHFHGGSGSLIIESGVLGGEHLGKPFTIGRIDPKKGYVHILDDTSLNVVMAALDTASDFVAYLTKKERLTTGDVRVFAAGEEELLARYVAQLNSSGEHDFAIPRKFNGIFLEEGHWADFLSSPEHKAQIEANRISYAWDALIERFLHHLMEGTQYKAATEPIGEQEQSFRWLARENRTRRRMLAQALLGLIAKTPEDFRASRVMLPSRPGDPFYVFLLLPRYDSVSETDYREVRGKMLGHYCQVVKLQFPEAQHIVGIATESGTRDHRSEDFAHVDATHWTEDLRDEARRFKRDFGIFTNTTSFSRRENEYPVSTRETGSQPVPISRNSPCPCNSGKRYKRCHGAGMFSSKKRKVFPEDGASGDPTL